MSARPAGGPTNRKAEQSEATRGTLLRIARELFTERGYAGTATEEVVQRAGVTRGALYHQFRDKRDLFQGVFEQMEGDLAGRIAKAARSARGSWDKLLAGCQACLDAYLDPAIRRVVLVDGPSVLGRETWHQIDGAYALEMVRRGLEAAVDDGVMARQPLAPLAALLVGALNEAGMVISHAADVRTARTEMGTSLVRLLDGLRTPRPARQANGRRHRTPAR